jgi:hypothetical protein
MVLGTPNRVLNLTPGNSTCTPQIDDICSFAAIREFKSIATANYNSLQVQLRKTFSQSQRAGGSYLTFGYTYSHTIDSASGFDSRNPAVPAYSPNQFRASSDSDLRHYLVSSGTWTLPLHYYFAALPARLTDGWSIAGLFSWRTGFPLDVFANLPTVYSFTSPGPSGAGDPGLVRANLVAPYQAVDPRSNSTFRGVSGNFWFSPDSFSNARCPSGAPLTGPNACVPGATILPSDSQVLANPLDFAISKSTPLIRDGLKLEARIEFFNALNHTEFLNPSTNIQDYFFGQITDTVSPRIIQLGLRLNF